MSTEQGENENENVTISETNDNISADTIIKTIETLNSKVDTATATAKANLEKLKQLLNKSGVDAKKQKEQTEEINTLQSEIAKLNESNTSLKEKAESLNRINAEIQKLDKNINDLIANNEEINSALENTSSGQSGGFQYNKKHSKHKRPFRLFSRSNSKTTSKKSKKRRRTPGKSVKKGGMKTRRRRRNKKSKKSKKRRK